MFNPSDGHIAPPCFEYEVITHPFPKPFIVHGVDKYFSNSKLDQCVSDYPMVVHMAKVDIDNALRYMPLCLTRSTRTWLNGLPPYCIHT